MSLDIKINLKGSKMEKMQLIAKWEYKLVGPSIINLYKNEESGALLFTILYNRDILSTISVGSDLEVGSKLFAKINRTINSEAKLVLCNRGDDHEYSQFYGCLNPLIDSEEYVANDYALLKSEIERVAGLLYIMYAMGTDPVTKNMCLMYK